MAAVELVAAWLAFIDAACARLDEGLFGLVSPVEALRNAAIAHVEVAL